MLLDGYVRVSYVGKRKGERFISPKVQQEQIETWASAHGAVLGEMFIELDQSGGRADRPLLLRALERVESHRSDGLIVAKLDRFGRSLVHGLAAMARIERAGGTFVSVQDGLDLGTPTGRLILRIMLAMAEWELERVRDNWDSARSQAVARGVHISGLVPIGFLRGEDGRLYPDPEVAPVIRQAFQRRAAGATSYEVAEFLNDSGVKKCSERPFDGGEIWRLISRRVYKGEAHHGRYTNPQAHEPVVDVATWQLAQFPRRNHWRIEGLLLGALRCASCGARMSANRPQARASESRVYHCSATSRGCPEPAGARADEIEPLVEEHLICAARHVARRRPKRALAEQEKAVEHAQRSLAEYRDNYRLQKTLGLTSFEIGIVRRQQHLEEKLLDLARAKRSVIASAIPLDNLEVRWKTLTMAQRRQVLAEFLDTVVVERGKRPLTERVWLCRRGVGPLRDSGGSAVRFDPVAAKARRPAAIRPWSERKIGADLFAFLGERGRWPPYEEFAAAGYGRLHAQVLAWGGPFFWAHRLGIAIENHDVRWNDARIRGAMQPLLSGRVHWPDRDEFETAGLAVLRRAIGNHGGPTRWASEFGLEHRGRRLKWPEERIRACLDRFLRGRESFPSRREFVRAGQERLYEAVRRRGGLAYWAGQYDLESPANRGGRL